jgi:hypothetical protein
MRILILMVFLALLVSLLCALKAFGAFPDMTPEPEPEPETEAE